MRSLSPQAFPNLGDVEDGDAQSVRDQSRDLRDRLVVSLRDNPQFSPQQLADLLGVSRPVLGRAVNAWPRYFTSTTHEGYQIDGIFLHPHLRP